MWLAKTSIPDGIYILVFATVLFLLLFGLVTLTRWIYRIIRRTPNSETVRLVFPIICNNEDEDEGDENCESMVNFAWFLHEKLRVNKLGYFADYITKAMETCLLFRGPNANQIWQMIHAEAKDKAPAKPLRVILERSRKNGGQQIIDAVAWQLTSTPLPRPVLPTTPEAWIRLSSFGQVLTILGIGGLFLWGMLRKLLKLSENEFRNTVFGDYSAWVIGIILIIGLTLKWLSYNKYRSLSRQAGFPTDESSTSTILKYVLLLVILIFGLVFVLCV